MDSFCCSGFQIPDGVVVKLEKVGQLVQQDSAWLSNNHLLYSNLSDRSVTHGVVMHCMVLQGPIFSPF